MSAADDILLVAPSGATYRLPVGTEIAAIDAFLTRMKSTGVVDSFRPDIDALLDARVLLTAQTGGMP